MKKNKGRAKNGPLNRNAICPTLARYPRTGIGRAHDVTALWESIGHVSKTERAVVYPQGCASFKVNGISGVGERV